MKLSLTFKTPHVVEDAIDQQLRHLELDEEQYEEKKAELEEAAEKWIQYSEYVTIEIDTETNTATVQKAKS